MELINQSDLTSFLSDAFNDEFLMDEVDAYYQAVQVRDAAPLSQHIACPEYGHYALEDFESGDIDCLEGEIVTLDTVVAYGTNYKGEGVTAGLATIAFIQSLG